MNQPVKQLIETDYEVKLGVFEGPLDLLLYLVQKNELNPREIPIAVITDQYLKYIDGGPQGGGIEKMNLSNAGEFLVMAARLMRLKARELLPAEDKTELEEMEYELDRQALIQQMLEYQKFKEAARVLRNFEGKNFGAFARGRVEDGEERQEEELEEAGVYDLLAAFRNVVTQKKRRIPVHEVEIDDVTIEDRMQEVEIALSEQGRLMFEDLFPHDHRTIMKVVTLMAMLELCKLDRVVFRQSHALGPIWLYRKLASSPYELELKVDEGHQDPLPDFKPGLPELIREQAKQRTAQTALEAALRELEEEMLNPGAAAEKAAAREAAEREAAAQAAAAKAESAARAESAEAAGITVAGVPDAVAATEADAAGPAAGETAVTTDTVEEVEAAVRDTDALAVPVMEVPEEAAPEAEALAIPVMEVPEPDDPEADGSAPDEEEKAALRDLMERMREAPPPDLSVPDPDGDND
jgi:chromatin segregation and condensation protein Rec8/ScpA/Scc1 (kleisin family)